MLLRLFASAPRPLRPLLDPVQALHLRWLEQRLRSSQLSPVPLEAALRPLLFPNERWSDADSWRHDCRLLSWLRILWLRAQPSSQRILPRVSSTLRPPHLPTTAELSSLFEVDWLNTPSPSPSIERFQERRVRNAERPSRQEVETDETDESTRGHAFPWLLERAGAMIEGRGAMAVHCEDNGIYQLVSREYVESLAEYISGRRAQLNPSGGRVRVLEVGAGNGELAYHLREALEERGGAEAWELTASDHGKWGLASSHYPYSAPFRQGILELSYAAAIRTVRPHLVLAAWMPMESDWTAEFRRTAGINEYILLGEAFDGACGHNWKTWLVLRPILPSITIW